MSEAARLLASLLLTTGTAGLLANELALDWDRPALLGFAISNYVEPSVPAGTYFGERGRQKVCGVLVSRRGSVSGFAWGSSWAAS